MNYKKHFAVIILTQILHFGAPIVFLLLGLKFNIFVVLVWMLNQLAMGLVSGNLFSMYRESKRTPEERIASAWYEDKIAREELERAKL